MSETLKRVAVAAIGVPIAVGIVYLGGWALAALLAAVSVLAALEFYRMAELKRALPLRWIGCGLAASLVLVTALRPERGIDGGGAAALLAAGALAAAAAAIWQRGVEGEPLLSVSTTLFGALYTGGLLSFGLMLRHLPGVTDPWHGTALVFAPVLLTWTSDTFAYFVGRAWGRRKLIPRVSPGKTVEGSLGALVGSVVVAVAYAHLLYRVPHYHMHIPEAALFGVLMSVAAQVGDLAESLLKRDAGVKDSGTLLPGHGGALDRFDSLFFTLPIAYFFLLWVAG